MMVSWLFALVFGLVAAEPGADHSAAVLAGAPADADVAVYYNVEATAKPAWDFVRNDLAKEPLVKAMPKVSQGLEELMREIERPLAELESSLGLDPFNDVHFAAAWLGVRAWEGEDPSDFSLLIAIHGKFPKTLLEKAVASIAPQFGKTTLSGVDAWSTGGGGKPELVVAQLDGVVIGGTRDWVEARIAAKKPSGDQAARMKKKLAGGAVVVLDVVPSRATRTRLSANVDNVSASELLGGFDTLTMALFADGLDLELQARSDALYTRYQYIFNALLESMSAGRSASRVLTYLVLGIPSPKDTDLPPELIALLSQPDEVLGLLEVFVGSGDISSTDRSDKKKKLVSIEARAGHVRQLMLSYGLLLFSVINL